MPNKNTKKRIKRPPVVVVMGHIDHGKSTLLDFIRKSNIVAGEAGGITQHVGAYQAEHIGSDGIKHEITFLDTPGHEAFCTIRERGAKAADVAILVVSAEDGVKPQTIEALNEIKNAKIPYVVAINKIDKPNADINKTKQSLGENEVYLEGWGGDIPNVSISSLNGEGVSELLDMVILISELADLKTDPDISAEGIVIESKMDTRRGIQATLLVKDGTLGIGTFAVAGVSYTPIRFIEDFKGQKIDRAIASMPVIISGWNEIPVCGSTFTIVDTKKEAEKLVEDNMISISAKLSKVATIEAATNGDFAKRTKAFRRAEEGATESKSSIDSEQTEIVSFPIIIKADVIGSLDGVKHELAKLKHDKVQIKIVSEGIGDINENDVKIALGDPNITIIGFNSIPDKKVTTVIEHNSVNVKTFRVIYELIQFVHDSFLAKVPKEYIEESTGRAKILAIFSKERDRQVIGGKVESGTISAGNEVKIIRRNSEIGRGKVRELQEKKMRTSEVAEGHEFGVMVEAKVEIAVGDRVEAVKTVEKIG